MPYSQQPWVDNVTPVDAAHMLHLEAGIAAVETAIPVVPTIPYGTSLPASPADGQLAILVDSTTNPSYQWKFRYNAGSSSAYKWEFIGGPPLRNNILIAGSIAVANTWTDVGGPSICPRAGDYLVTFQSQVQATAFTSAYNIDLRAIAGVQLGGLLTFIATAAFAGTYFTSTTYFLGVAASDAVKTQGRIASAQSTTFGNPFIYITPLRVA
jgi:hypothetical protein